VDILGAMGFVGGMTRSLPTFTSFFCPLFIALGCLLAPRPSAAGLLDDLAKPQEGISRRVSSTFRQGSDGKYDPKAAPKGDEEEASNRDNRTVPPGGTWVLMDERGPGVITHIWITFLGPEPQPWAKQGSATHQEMLLRMYWDGDRRPAVEAPLGDFFANGFGIRSEVISLPVVVDHGNSYNCFWRMPFRKSARVEIVNQSDKPISLLYYNLDWLQLKRLPASTPYFHAQYRQEYPAEHGKDYVVLDTEGKGHYVGTVLNVRTRSPSWFGEGDEKIYLDGEKTASIWGTGTEDYFMSAWGLKKTSTPYAGVPFFDQWGVVGSRTSAYRWHLNDPIVFQKGLKVTFEHFGWISPDESAQHRSTSWNERQDDYSSVAFWYQTGPSTFTARAPHARERRLPSLERVTVPARNFSGPAHHGQGEAGEQQLELYPEPQLLYRPSQAADAWLEIPFEVPTREPLRLLLNATRSYDFGKYQAFVDGVKVGPVLDFFNDTIVSQEFHLLDFWPEPGRHLLRLECVGKNPKSEGWYLGLESVRLRERRPRVASYGYDRDKDWRKDPGLYE